jgi:penicillin-binding protein 2
MTERPRILQELGEELDRAARRTLVGGEPGRIRGVAGAATVALASMAVVLVAVLAIVMIGSRSHRPIAGSATALVRGRIVDRGGRTLVGNKGVMFVRVTPSALPRASSARDAELKRLARVLGIVELRLPTARNRRGLPPVYQRDVSPAIARYLLLHLRELPGVDIQRGSVRQYPFVDLAAQLFGTVGSITPPELTDAHYRGASQNDVVGQSGLESYYDSSLRAGDTVKLSLDVNLERAGAQALRHALSANRPASGGAFVALNPDTGEVYAMGSNPSFDSNILTKPVSPSVYGQLNNPSSNFSLMNRAIQSAGPTGSTFEPITATAALQSGAWKTSEVYDDTGQFCVGSGGAGQCRHNAGGASYGPLDLSNALRVSSGDFFYNLGALTNADPSTHPNGGALQQWASSYGIGQKTGIDLGGELAGNLPSPRWRTAINKLEVECEKGVGPYKGRKPIPSCRIADGRPWSIGDNISLAVGQGDVQVTPLQLAVAYAAIANGGTVVRPHLAGDIQRSDGTILQQIDPPPVRHLNINPEYLRAIRQGLRSAASQPGGTSADVFRRFAVPVYGETGTAQHTGQHDYAWYAGYVPPSATSKPIVVIVTVQQGGFGAQAAAPVARQILSQWFLGRPGPWIQGKSRTL